MYKRRRSKCKIFLCVIKWTYVNHYKCYHSSNWEHSVFSDFHLGWLQCHLTPWYKTIVILYSLWASHTLSIALFTFQTARNIKLLFFPGEVITLKSQHIHIGECVQRYENNMQSRKRSWWLFSIHFGGYHFACLSITSARGSSCGSDEVQ